jgi:hypothetical protein
VVRVSSTKVWVAEVRTTAEVFAYSGTSGYYRYGVLASTGSGSYTIGDSAP